MHYTATHCNTIQVAAAHAHCNTSKVIVNNMTRTTFFNNNTTRICQMLQEKYIAKESDLLGFARVKLLIPASMECPLSVVKIHSTLQRTTHGQKHMANANGREQDEIYHGKLFIAKTNTAKTHMYSENTYNNNTYSKNIYVKQKHHMCLYM